MMVAIFAYAVTSMAGSADRPHSASQPCAKSYFETRERGWFWYEMLPEERSNNDDEKQKETISHVAPQTRLLSPKEQLEQQGRDWENAVAKAVLQPTRVNVMEYLRLTYQINAQAHRFSNAFKETIWETPEYDYTLESPVTTDAIVARGEQQAHAAENLLRRAAQNRAVLFFFRGDCPVCHRMAPIVRAFTENFGFVVVAVSADGGALPEYPKPQRNIEIGGKLNISVVPALFLVDPETNRVATIGYGYSDWSMLTQKTLHAAAQLTGAAKQTP